MKNTITKQAKTRLVLLFTTLCISMIYGQNSEAKKDLTPNSMTEQELNDSIVQFNYQFKNPEFTVDSLSPVTRYVNNLKKEQELFKNNHPNSDYEALYSGMSLNYIFSKKLETVFNASNDLSLQKTYFNLNADEKSFSIGYNFDNRRGEVLKQLDWVMSVGAKIVASDDFAAIATGSDLEENNIGLTYKFTWVSNGKIGWRINAKRDSSKIKSQRDKIEANRRFLYHSYNEKVKEYNKKIALIEERYKEIYDYDKYEEKIKDEIKDYSDELFYEMIKEEMNFVESEGLYSSINNSWWTFEAYIPLGDKEYKITPITPDNKPTDVLYYPFNINVSWNFFTQKCSDFSYFGKVTGRVKGNSNIEVEGLKSEEFQSITIIDDVPTLTNPVNAIPVDKFDRFVTPSIKAEVAFFLKGNRFGFSPSIEKNFGTYDGVNWKLGIPISLKDKEGKPTVNFELQWRENKTLSGNEHLFGFTTSFFFGDLIKSK